MSAFPFAMLAPRIGPRSLSLAFACTSLVCTVQHFNLGSRGGLASCALVAHPLRTLCGPLEHNLGEKSNVHRVGSFVATRSALPRIPRAPWGNDLFEGRFATGRSGQHTVVPVLSCSCTLLAALARPDGWLVCFRSPSRCFQERLLSRRRPERLGFLAFELRSPPRRRRARGGVIDSMVPNRVVGPRPILQQALSSRGHGGGTLSLASEGPEWCACVLATGLVHHKQPLCVLVDRLLFLSAFLVGPAQLGFARISSCGCVQQRHLLLPERLSRALCALALFLPNLRETNPGPVCAIASCNVCVCVGDVPGHFGSRPILPALRLLSVGEGEPDIEARWYSHRLLITITDRRFPPLRCGPSSPSP